MRYFLKLAYNGAPFHGWQIQPNSISVQATIETALSTLLRKKIEIVGAGRTDAGVHAKIMYAHFDCENIILDKAKFLSSLNSIVGKNIVINDILPVASDAHARFDASGRTYKYFITTRKSPFIKDFCWFTPSSLDVEMMNEVSKILLETTDFTSFAKLHSDAKTNICKVSEAKWMPANEDKEAWDFLGNLNEGFVFTISADRFLRNMVRAIVGTLIEVGRGKMSAKEFKTVIDNKNRCAAGTSMPAHALFLWDIQYPSSIFLSS